MSGKLRWGILGTGVIARTMAAALAKSRAGKLVAVASRSQVAADKFGDDFQISPAKRYCDYQKMLEDPEVKAIYIATPHTQHASAAIQAIEASKHVLVEKPIAVSESQADAVIEAASRNKVLLMEAFMYRCHPQTMKLVDLLKGRAIGELRMIQATNSFDEPFDPQSRLYNPSLGGGSILDIGCYPMSMARLLAGAANGRSFENPVELQAVGNVSPDGVDRYTIAAAKFPGEILAQLSAGISVNQESTLRLFGTRGKITVPNPWVDSYSMPQEGRILIDKNQSAMEEIIVPAMANSFTYEADLFADCVAQGLIESPAMTWADSLGNTRSLDCWRSQVS